MCILCTKSFTISISRPNHVAPGYVFLNFEGGEKDPQKDEEFRQGHEAPGSLARYKLSFEILPPRHSTRPCS